MKHETGNRTHDFRSVCAEGDGWEKKRQFKSNSLSFGLKRSGGGCCAADNSSKKTAVAFLCALTAQKYSSHARIYVRVFFLANQSSLLRVCFCF